MTDYVISPPVVPSLPVAGSQARFPVRRIFCVGRNYADHAREMGHDPDREPPFFFDKPADALVVGEADIPYPTLTDRLEHEAELVVALGKGGRDIEPASALDLVWGYAIGNDLTRRDIQAEAKKLGRPWTMAKGFDGSAVCGPIHPVSEIGHPAKGAIALSVNGTVRQTGDLSQMIWAVPDVIAALSQFVELRPGDLIYSGTPAGVGGLERGDVVEISIEGLGKLTNRVSA
ncbi:fumarylacetoacetate (FAA) hydrolase [Nitratireductor indicus C115]|uniref:Fumarylacetoacetate (FAA) hydrolase n=1 Tax=Nitratireductor indicus C115 TaxID=1231190 RepID=K2NTJ7_9HYPH|nr:fumarylacetoacetate hydrolase family protein [Nitratireductor indicus]EKF42590.1 fumarylacetoacetate (FAA) hydrolase [Nitratireductor indicus C115]SFQ57663.1 fumarylpyruvate hydrolase [Nitratireductor indicus]